MHSLGICPLSLLPACGIWNFALCEAEPKTPTYSWSSQLLSAGNHMLGSNVNVIFYFASTNSIFEKPLIQKLPDLSNIYILRKSSLIWTNQMLSNSCLIPKCPAGTLAVTSTGSDFCAFLYEIFLSFKHKSIGDFFFSFFLMFEPKASSVLAFGLYLLCP